MNFPPPVVRWYALRLRSRFEFSVRDTLRAAGIEEFLPTMATESRWSDRTAIVTRALFPGYLFARFDDATAAADIVATRGVVEILSIGLRPEPISDDAIADLRRAVESRAIVGTCPYVAGSTVRVKSGPFAGIEGIVTRVKDGALLTIPMPILGRSVNVAIDASDVEKL